MILLLIFLSMSLGQPDTEAPERKPYNIDAVETSSQQQNIAVPYFAGVHPCPAHWVEDLVNVVSVDVPSPGGGKGGKGGGGTDSGQKNWYGDIAFTTNICPDDAPNDAILHILVNGEPVLGGNDPLNPQALYRAPGTHYVAFSIPKYAQACRFYWGTKEQPVDDLVLSHLPNKHPGYHNRGLFVAKRWFCGSSPNVQSIVIILMRGTKFFATRFEAGPAGVNPMGPAFELITDPLCGCGFPESRLVQASFENTAASMTAANMLLAPALDSARSAPSVLADYFQYFDGFLRRTGSNLEIGYFTHGDVDVGVLPELGSSDIIGEAQIKTGDIADTRNTFWINFANRAKWYQGDDTERYIDQPNYLKVQVLREDNAERTFIIDGEIAVRQNIGRGKIRALEKHSATLNVRRDRVDLLNLRQGDRFKSNIDSLSLSFVWRIVSRDTPSDRSGVYKFSLENERGIYPTHFVPPPAPGPPGLVIVPTAIENARIVELPSGLTDSSAIQVCILAQRPSTHIIGARVWVAPDLEEGIFDLIGTLLQFASYGKVAVAYPNSTADLDITTGLVVDLEGEDIGNVVPQTDAQRDDNRLLIWCNGEISSAGQVTALGGDRVKIFQRRALYGTQKGNHFVDAPVFFLYRDWIRRIAHQSFAPDVTRFFKLVPFTTGGDYDIDLVDPIAYHFAGGAVAPIFNLQLSTSAGIVAGREESRIAASWDWAHDQDIATFDVALKRVSDPEEAWQTRSSGASPFTDWVVQPATPYMVKVRPVNSQGEPGDWCTPATIVSASISPFSITGLELVGQGNNTECRERDFNFGWRLNSPDWPIPPGGDPIPPGVNDPQLHHYIAQVLVGDVVIYEELPTTNRFYFSYEENIAASAAAGLSGPQALITCKIVGVDTFGNPTAPALLTVQNSAPVPVSNLTAFGAQNRTVLLGWGNGSEPDRDTHEIYRGTSPDPLLAPLIAIIDARNNVFVDTLPNVAGTVVFNYWVKTTDSFGNKSPFSVGASAESGPPVSTIGDLDQFEIDITTHFVNGIIRRGDQWSANTPAAGSISWNAHNIIHAGNVHPVAAGDTALKYVYWNVGDAAYTTSAIQLEVGDVRFLVVQNSAGTPRQAWSSFANVLIGFANILEASIVDAHIVNCSVSRLIAGTILGQEIILRNEGLTPCGIRSYDYVPGVAGFFMGMDPDGDAFLEICDGFFRGVVAIGGGDTSCHIDSGGNLWIGNALQVAAPFRVSNTGDLFCRNATIEDALWINTLSAPMFVNLLDSGNPMYDRSYTDNDDISLSVTAPAGKKVRFETGTTKRVSTNSPFWPNAANTGDGVGPDDFLGYVFNHVAGNNHSRISGLTRACTEVGSFLSDEVAIQLAYTPVAGVGLPTAPPPLIYFRGGTRGSNGYSVWVASSLSGATVMISIDVGVTYTPDTSGSPVRVDLNADESVMAFVTVPGYAPSAVAEFWNTARSIIDPGYNGPPGTDPP